MRLSLVNGGCSVARNEKREARSERLKARENVNARENTRKREDSIHAALRGVLYYNTPCYPTILLSYYPIQSINSQSIYHAILSNTPPLHLLTPHFLASSNPSSPTPNAIGKNQYSTGTAELPITRCSAGI